MVVVADINVLSLTVPWGWVVCKGWKPLENRSWDSKFRGRLYIHASNLQSKMMLDRDSAWIADRLQPAQRAEYWKAWADTQAGRRRWGPQTSGLIIGHVDVVDWVSDVATDDPERRWYTGMYAAKVERAVLFTEPIPAKGKQQIWHMAVPAAQLTAAQAA